MDKAHISTEAQLHRTERQLNKLYNQLHRDIVNDINPYWDDLLIEDEEATHGQRLRYAERNGTLDAVIAIVVARIVSTNEQATNIINDGLSGVYGTNYDYWQAEFLKWYPDTHTLVKPMIPNKDKLIEQMQNRYDKRAYDHATDFKYVSKDVRKAVIDGIKRGESIPNIKKRIKSIGEGHSKRSLMATARTETGRFMNIARTDAYKELEKLGAKITRVWIATHDSRTRDTHAHMDGERAGVDEEFSNGLLYPCDPRGEAEETINCRCTTIAEVSWN